MERPRSCLSWLLEIIIIIACLVGLVVLIVLIVLGYHFKWDWAGLGSYISPPHPKDSDFQRGKTLWDWLQLLIIPAVLALGGYLFTFTSSRTEREIASDRQREVAFQSYIDQISELLLHEKLRESGQNDEVRKIGRVRTLTVLPRLDSQRKASLLQFLHESDLINKDNPIVDISGGDLRRADLRLANLSQAYLVSVNLQGAILRRTDLTGANLFLADLRDADLHYARVTNEQLERAKKPLTGTTMPNGLKHL